jgi:hypothetical protein
MAHLFVSDSVAAEQPPDGRNLSRSGSPDGGVGSIGLGAQPSRAGDESERLEEDILVFGICNRVSEFLGPRVVMLVEGLVACGKGGVGKHCVGKRDFPIWWAAGSQELVALPSVPEGDFSMS